MPINTDRYSYQNVKRAQPFICDRSTGTDAGVDFQVQSTKPLFLDLSHSHFSHRTAIATNNTKNQQQTKKYYGPPARVHQLIGQRLCFDKLAGAVRSSGLTNTGYGTTVRFMFSTINFQPQHQNSNKKHELAITPATFKTARNNKENECITKICRKKKRKMKRTQRALHFSHDLLKCLVINKGLKTGISSVTNDVQQSTQFGWMVVLILFN